MIKILLVTITLLFNSVAFSSDRAFEVSSVVNVSREIGVDENYMCKIAKIESNWKKDAVNRGTNAKGLFQITRPTELSLRKRYNIIGNIFDPYVNTKLAALLTKEHMKKSNSTDFTDLYIYHFLGMTGARKLLRTDGNTRVRYILPKAYKYNKNFIGNRTINEFKQLITDKLNKAPNCKEIYNG